MRERSLRVVAVALLLPLSSCAYYNTFYKARSYYEKGAEGAPYLVDKPVSAATGNFTRSIEYSKKVITQYPKSKWVDDAYLLWAKALLGKDDPVQTMTMLGDFATRYPNSPLRDEALFYFGVAGRKARKYPEALGALEEFLKRAPKHRLAPYAWLEQSRVLTALKRPADAATAASKVVTGYRSFRDPVEALELRADALLAMGEPGRARADYQTLGLRAASDEDRFNYLLKEADCLESARLYDEEAALLRTALGHEDEPRMAEAAPQTTLLQQAKPDTLPSGQVLPPPGSGPTYLPATPTNNRWGRLTIRMGTMHLLAGHAPEGLKALRTVVTEFPGSWLASEAQYRVAFYYETIADDFDAARDEYARVSRLAGGSPYTAQANERLANLMRLTQVRSSSGRDSLARRAEAAFMRAELYLFQNNRPERAMEEYQQIAAAHPGTAWAGKAVNAQAWVLRNRMDRGAAAESLWWQVVRDYPRTVAQLDARDYLEREGRQVPDSLIKLPELVAAADSGRSAPAALDTLALRRAAAQWADSARMVPMLRAGDQPIIPTRPHIDDPDLKALMASNPDSLRARAHADSLMLFSRRAAQAARARADSLERATMKPDTTAAPADTTDGSP